MERETMVEGVGRFRTVSVEDLTKFRYGGDARQARQDLRNVAAQGLFEKRTVSRDSPLQSIVTFSDSQFLRLFDFA
jgi:hypothetical protein